MSATVPMVTVALGIQPETGGVPLTFSRLVAVQGVPADAHAPNTIVTGGTSVFADAPANVIVGPAVLLAPDTVTVPANPAIALIAAATFALLIVVPPFPSTAERLPPIMTWYELPALAALKLANVIACCSFPPWSAAAMPAVVLFWPRVIGYRVGAVVVQRVGVAVRVVAGERHGLHFANPLKGRLDPCGRVVDAVRDRRRDVAVVVQLERVERTAVVRLLDRGEAAAAAQVDDLDARHVEPGRRAAVGDREAGRSSASDGDGAREAHDGVDRRLDVRVRVRRGRSRRSRPSRSRRS